MVAAKKTAAKKVSGRELLAKMRKEDSDIIGRVEDFDLEIVGQSTGNISIDFLSGIGGVPKGRIIESYGPYSSGKTTAAIMTMGQMQKRMEAEGDEDGLLIFVDYEHTFDSKYALALGLDSSADNFVYMAPNTLEEGMNTFRQLLDTGDVRLVIFDSVAAMVPEGEIEAETGKAEVGLRAKLLNQSCRQITGKLAKYGTTAWFCNHVQEKIDTSYMGRQLASRGIKQWVSPGGTALPFYASFRIFFEKAGTAKSKEFDALGNTDDEEVTGQKIKMTVTKNKVGPAFRVAELRIHRGKGFSQAYSVYNVLESHGLIKKSGSWIKVNESVVPETLKEKVDDKGWMQMQGEDNLIKAIESSPEWLRVAENKAREILTEFGLPTVDGSLYNSDGEVDAEKLLKVNKTTGEVADSE